jgi:MFS family permease
VSDHRAESITVNAAGLVQGIALVTFPAASGIFTSHSDYNLSSSQYGLMFAPQVVTAIIASLLSAGLLWPGFTARVSEKETYLAGLVADLAAMALLMVSWTVVHQHAAAYVLLLAATACLGAGFGFAVPSLNTLTAALHPGATDRSVLVLNALLGLGTALAPAFVAVFNGIGFWVGLPLLAAVLLAGLIAVSLRLPLRPGQTQPRRNRGSTRLPVGFWLFGAFALLYGICETMNGNWSQLELTSLGIKSSTASLALTGFWALVTIGRVLLAVVQRWLPSRAAYHVLPFVLAAAFVLIAALPHHAPGAAVAAFCLAGLGCSALLPLTISFGQEKLTDVQTEVAGGVIACYQVGYGVAAFGVGPLVSAGVRLPAIFAGSAVIAAVMGAFSLVVAHGRPSPASVHPRPAPPRARALEHSTSLRRHADPLAQGLARGLAGWLADRRDSGRLAGAPGGVARDPPEHHGKQDRREHQRQEQELKPVPQGVPAVPRPRPPQTVAADHGDYPSGDQGTRDDLVVRAQHPEHLGRVNALADHRDRAGHRDWQQHQLEPVPQRLALETGPAQRDQVARDHEPGPGRQGGSVHDGSAPADVVPVLDPQRDGPRDHRHEQELEPVPQLPVLLETGPPPPSGVTAPQHDEPGDGQDAAEGPPQSFASPEPAGGRVSCPAFRGPLPDCFGRRRPRQAGFRQPPGQRGAHERSGGGAGITTGGTSIAAVRGLIQGQQGIQPEQFVRLDCECHGRHGGATPQHRNWCAFRESLPGRY